MQIGLNTDYCRSTGNPAPWLKAMAEAGFSHVHWCHQWNTDFLYTKPEIDEIRSRLKEYGLTLMDIHGSAGMEKCWFSTEEYQRKAGVLLVLNRIQMLRELNGVGALIMHIPAFRESMPPEEHQQNQKMYEQLRRSLDELMPQLEKYDEKIAVENGFNDTFEIIADLMKSYPAERLGITYDSGHGNIQVGKGLDYLEPLRNRILVLHLNDNGAQGDQHQPPFYGTVNWERMTGILADSTYSNPLSFELSIRNTPFADKELKDQPPEAVKAFLADAYERCGKVVRLYESKRK